MNTVGYRADGVSFETEVAKAGDNRIAYVSPGSTFISRQTGATVKTGNPFDVAVQGDGWMAISNANGVAYTRDGRMRISETGALETLNGNAVLDAGGAPIILNPAGQRADDFRRRHDRAGRQASRRDRSLRDRRRRQADAHRELRRHPRQAGDAHSRLHAETASLQGFVEGANVNPIQEMTKLIAVTRAFDGVNSQVSQTEASLQDAIKTLGAVRLSEACNRR